MWLAAHPLALEFLRKNPLRQRFDCNEIGIDSWCDDQVPSISVRALTHRTSVAHDVALPLYGFKLTEPCEAKTRIFL